MSCDERSRSVSSMRSTNTPPDRRANSQLNNAVRAPPTCRYPVGDGAKRTRGEVMERTRVAVTPGVKSGGEAGIRTLSPHVSNLVMARDFWRQGFEFQLLTASLSSGRVPASPLHSTGVLETYWRRPLAKSELDWIQVSVEHLSNESVLAWRNNRLEACQPQTVEHDAPVSLDESIKV